MYVPVLCRNCQDRNRESPRVVVPGGSELYYQASKTRDGNQCFTLLGSYGSRIASRQAKARRSRGPIFSCQDEEDHNQGTYNALRGDCKAGPLATLTTLAALAALAARGSRQASWSGGAVEKVGRAPRSRPLILAATSWRARLVFKRGARDSFGCGDQDAPLPCRAGWRDGELGGRGSFEVRSNMLSISSIVFAPFARDEKGVVTKCPTKTRGH